jgi:hypothetical protein
MAQQDYQTRYFLNSVDPDLQSIGNVTPGLWKSDDDAAAGFLKRYAQSIRVEGEVADLGQVHSVPSVFARPILFAQAIGSKARGGDGSTDVTGPVHEAVRAEWRGILAAFALSDYFGYDLALEEYSLPKLEDIPQKYEGLSGSNDNYFRIMLRSQLPKPESAWTAWKLIYCDGVLIGATSPWTVVYTPAEYSCPGSIPWVRDLKRKRLGGETASYRVFADPVEYFRGKDNRRELRILDLWLKDLLDQHTKSKWDFKKILLQEELADTWSGALKRELEAWRTEIAGVVLKEEKFTVHPGSQYHPDEPYSFFLHGCEVDSGREELSKSDILLDTRTPGQEVLAFSRKQGADPKLRVYGSVFGDQVDVARLKGSQVEGSWRTDLGREIPSGYVIAEDVFFPKKLAEMPLSENAINCGSKRFALPLTSTFFKYFDPHELKPGGKVKLKVTEAVKRVTARLELPLKNGKTLAVERQYDFDDAEEVLHLPLGGLVPAMAIWPDFYDTSWRSYIAVYFGGSQRDVALKICAAPVGGTGDIHPWTTLDGTQTQGRLWESDKAFAGFLLREYREDGRLNEVGLVLADQRKLNPVDKGASWDVSLDFGTSNTAVAHFSRDSERRIADLEGRTRLLTSNILPEYVDHVRMDFYPQGKITQPFVTALKDQTKDYISLEGRLDYQLITDLAVEHVTTIVPNVKWGTQGGRKDEEPMKAFLTHVVRLIMAQARADGVHSVNLRWSYPLALPAPVKTAMRSFWSTLGNAFVDPAVMSLLVERQGIPESDAVCRQLARRSPVIVKVQSGSAISVMVDVGGGSTDIGFWSGAKLLDQISAKLAGNDILDPRLLGQASFRDALLTTTGIRLVEAEAGKINLFVNAALSKAAQSSGPNPYHHPIVEAALKSPASEPWYSLRSLIYLHFAGITYFVGLAARRFLWGDEDGKNVYLFYGGRAAALLAWLGSPEDTRDALGNIFKAGANSPKAAKLGDTVEISGHLFDPTEFLPLKHEVAIGCLYGPVGNQEGASGAPARRVAPVGTTVQTESGPIPGQSAALSAQEEAPDPDSNRRVILGEEQCTDEAGKPLDFFTEVDAREMGRIRLPSKAASSSTMITAFLEGALKRYGTDLSLDIAGLQSCRPQTDTTQTIIAQATEDGRVLQPVFISELASVMKTYAMKISKQNH